MNGEVMEEKRKGRRRRVRERWETGEKRRREGRGAEGGYREETKGKRDQA